MKSTWLLIISRFAAWFIGLFVFIYFIVSFVTVSDLKHQFNSSTINEVTSRVHEDAVRFIFAQEITPLRIKESITHMNVGNLILQLTTSVNFKDNRSLFGREIPGIDIYHTEIVVAGEGTDITTLPIESPLPEDDSLSSQDINQDELNRVEDDNSEAPTLDIKEKSVFIYHAHSWEAFKPLLADGGTSSDNEKVNIVAVGNQLKAELEERGIGVQHDNTNVSNGLKQNGLQWSDSYPYARTRVEQAMGQNDRLKYFIDIHRDSLPKDLTTTTINGKSYARIFFIVGKENKNYEQNLEFAKQLNQILEEKYPGLSRGVGLKGKTEGNGVYNQDLSNRAILLEFGGVDNNLVELFNSVEVLADVFSQHYWQAEEVTTTE